MLYFKQILNYRLTPWSTNWFLTEIPNDNRNLIVIGNRNIYKKCEYGRNQYLFIYRLVLKKIIEILDCIVKDNQKEFIVPHKNINFYYPLLTFIYSDIGIGRWKFLFSQIDNEVNFDELESLAGDSATLVSTWSKVRKRYIDHLGEIENLYAMGGFKEHHIPVRMQIVFEQVDQILEYQRKQYLPKKIIKIEFSKNRLCHNGKTLKFKSGVRSKIVGILSKNCDGISSQIIRSKLELSYQLFKTNIRDIKKRISNIDLTIYYDKSRKVYRIVSGI